VELTHAFTVSAPVEQAWAVLTDLERIAPCMPGAQLQEVDGDDHRGTVKVKVGPMGATYTGVARFVERDEAAHRAIVRAEGRDTRGQGNAAATITATLAPDGAGTRVALVTDLAITGKVAQFGRGVLAEVSTKLLDQFVAALEADVLADAGPPADGATPAPTPAPAAAAERGGPGPAVPAPGPGPRAVAPGPAVAPVDLVGTAGTSVLKRVGPVVAALAVVAWLLRRR
jgi:carbon monoxide dehydrogenase subunit G